MKDSEDLRVGRRPSMWWLPAAALAFWGTAAWFWFQQGRGRCHITERPAAAIQQPEPQRAPLVPHDYILDRTSRIDDRLIPNCYATYETYRGFVTKPCRDGRLHRQGPMDGLRF